MSHLIENGAYQYMNQVLHQCHDNRVNIYLYVLNISVFLIFTLGTCAILYYCYSHKQSPLEEYNRLQKEQEYVLSKIRFYKDHQRTIQSKVGITGLPVMDTRPL
jgi:hypothetical protein